MKVSTQLAVACLASGAYSFVMERDFKTVSGVLDQVMTSIDSLDSTVKQFTSDGGPLDSAAAKLISTLKSGKTTVDGSSDLEAADAIQLSAPVMKLQTKGETLTKDLEAKKPAIEKAGLCDSTRQQVTDINTASQALVKSVVAKVPEEVRSIAADLAAGLTKVLQEAQDAFSEANCKNSGGGGGGGTTAPGTTAPGTTAPGSTAPASTAPVSTASASAPATEPTGSASIPANPTGSVTLAPPVSTAAGETSAGVVTDTGAPAPTGTPAVVVGGAGSLAAPAGALVMALVAAVL